MKGDKLHRVMSLASTVFGHTNVFEQIEDVSFWPGSTSSEGTLLFTYVDNSERQETRPLQLDECAL